MWKLSIATFEICEGKTHKHVSRTDIIEFKTRHEAEFYMADYVENNAKPNYKFLGFLDTPWGDHFTLDPTLVFWLYHPLFF